MALGDFSYKEDKKYIPLPMCTDYDDNEKIICTGFIDTTRKSNVGVKLNCSLKEEAEK